MLQVVIRTVNLSFYQYNSILKKASWLLLSGIIAGLNISPVSAQKNININQDSIDRPIVISGTSGGTIKVLNITQTENSPTGYCDGFVNPQPNHILTIDTFFDYLRLEVDSPADTTILVRGAGGVWCNDDAGSANPMIEGQWQPGMYQIWVGSYQPNSMDNYQIRITDY
ncbi:MAG: hypothetical protein ACFCAD_10430 [Pleurocapsa sp.]